MVVELNTLIIMTKTIAISNLRPVEKIQDLVHFGRVIDCPSECVGVGNLVRAGALAVVVVVQSVASTCHWATSVAVSVAIP